MLHINGYYACVDRKCLQDGNVVITSSTDEKQLLSMKLSTNQPVQLDLIQVSSANDKQDAIKSFIFTMATQLNTAQEKLTGFGDILNV